MGDKDPRDETPKGWEWRFGGPPRDMAPGQYMERAGSLGGGIVVEYTSVPTPDGEMLIQKTSEMRNGRPIEAGHATRHGGKWFDRYPE